jgi:hypothetical protein
MRFSALTLLSFGITATCKAISPRHGPNLILRLPELNLALSFPLLHWDESLNSTIGMGGKDLLLSFLNSPTQGEIDEVQEVRIMFVWLASVSSIAD